MGRGSILPLRMFGQFSIDYILEFQIRQTTTQMRYHARIEKEKWILEVR